ncbi:sulfotransferase family 2 domain-containing protein [Pararhodobacter zhoushanensis]|uniref:Sulfotransferase family 2 domain-containing protein n=1 Tax=Pararhodobacter zhoushanensis TaxID=2479545 RepID=A0ABT3GYZ8_9RHOB|nr:sulfotransferase family 2 domain-containing protein [Pararhodobacter zhoushanensis]MCW1932698.1 sulfotransferase family 2 domain-containing protein [Pararhodobacter zhoushanensis]
MLVFWEQRLVILATPKTGSTAIETALAPLASLSVMQPGALKHSDARNWQRFLRPYLRELSGQDFTAVALMREPIDWLGSWYRVRQREDMFELPGSTMGMSFADFIEGHLDTPRSVVADVGCQSAFLKGDDGRACGVDRLFRYEEIGGFVAYLEELLDFAIELPEVNVSPKGDGALPDALRARAQTRLSADYALYASIG